MTHRIDTKFDVPADSQPKINVGAYVRAVGEDLGTGIVVGINDSDMLNEKTNKIHHQRIYYVRWLDMNKGTAYTFRTEESIAPSARSVPKFATPEEAEAWMEAQLNPGHWTAAAQDAADSSSDIDVELRKLLEEGLGGE